jgi:hypothetical protein
MRRLALEYEIKNMSTLYEEKTASWQNAEFTFNKDFTAHLKLWEDGIEPEQISETWKKLQERAESFRVALKYLGNRHIDFKQKYDWPTYYFDDREFTPRTEEEIAIITDYLRGRRESFPMFYGVMPRPTLTASCSSLPAPLPQSMPLILPDLHRMAETIVAAEELVKYPDLVLKLAFLILEEFKGKHALNLDEQKMNYARDFVSHPICDKFELVTFVCNELPSAKLNVKQVRFDRNKKDHMAFVSKYAHLTLQAAKKLFNEEVRRDRGFV